jgi:hypothetical protein
MNGAAGNVVEEATVILVPTVSVMAAASVVCAKFL